MLGWEFPPFISGGLGTACHGLTKALSDIGVNIIFILPRSSSEQMENLRILGTSGWQGGKRANVKFRTIASQLRPYVASVTSNSRGELSGQKSFGCGGFFGCGEPAANYGGDMYREVYSYADKAAQIASEEQFDVIHAHDWMTYPAGMKIAAQSGKPLLVQVHSTEFDRSGENINPMIYDAERAGMYSARTIVAVSNYTKNIIVSRYGVNPDKVQVVYNGVEHKQCHFRVMGQRMPRSDDKVVLFLGRVTMQKGPEYFIMAAKKVLDRFRKVKFVMAGDGDMLHRMIELAAFLGIGQKMLFTKFLRGEDVERVYQMADLYVMPSVSEPFGLTPLEAIDQDVPVLISKQSGISEILSHALKVDFWDINEMANKIIGVLKYPSLSRALRQNSRGEAGRFNWADSAANINRIYSQLIA